MSTPRTSRPTATIRRARPLRTESTIWRRPRATMPARLLIAKLPPICKRIALRIGPVDLGPGLHQGRRGVGHPRVVVAILDQRAGINEVSPHIFDPAHDPHRLPEAQRPAVADLQPSRHPRVPGVPRRPP